MYLHHLCKPQGILAFHISNLAVDLSPVIARLAAEADTSAWLSNAEIADNASPSTWVVVAAYNPAGLASGCRTHDPNCTELTLSAVDERLQQSDRTYFGGENGVCGSLDHSRVPEGTASPSRGIGPDPRP